MFANCRSQLLLDRLGRRKTFFVSTDSPSCHEFLSQFGPAIFLYAKKHPQIRGNRVARASVYLNKQAIDHDWSAATRRKAIGRHGWSPAIPSNSNNLYGDNCGHSGDRLSQHGNKAASQNGDNDRIPSRPEQFRVSYVAHAFVVCNDYFSVYVMCLKYSTMIIVYFSNS